MAQSEVESIYTSSNNSEAEEFELLFECVKCGERFNAAEKDAHRAIHKQQKRQRASSPNRSEATSNKSLFQQVPVPEASPGSPKKVRPSTSRVAALDLAKRKTERRAEAKKITSIKNFDKKIKPRRYIPG